MKEDKFEEIGKRLPYHESEEYLDDLLERVADTAISNRGTTQGARRWRKAWLSAAAVALLVIGIGLTIMNRNLPQQVVTRQCDGPIDEFLNSLTDEELAQLPYYEIEEIPEY